MTDSRERRALLPTRPNRALNLDYVISLAFALPLPTGEAQLFVRYVPDGLLLVTRSLEPYLATVRATDSDGTEQAAWWSWRT